MKCLFCGANELLGKQLKWCSVKCKRRSWKKRNAEKMRGYIREARRSQRAEIKQYIFESKKKPCMDCGATYHPFVMDYDHARGKKNGLVSAMGLHGWKSLKEEIAKCDLICANCHRIRTWSRLQAG